jgi:hypothetical protein
MGRIENLSGEKRDIFNKPIRQIFPGSGSKKLSVVVHAPRKTITTNHSIFLFPKEFGPSF